MSKAPGLTLAVLVLAGACSFPPNAPDEYVLSHAFTGDVIDVDLSGLAFDGPALILARDASGGTVTIAVPSIGLPLCEAYENLTPADTIAPGDQVSVAGELDPEGRVVPCSEGAHHLSVVSTVRDETLGYEFRYPKGPVGYVVVDDGVSQHPDFVSGHVLFDRREYEDFLGSTEARDGPPSISVRVYRNPQRLSAFVWPLRNPLESNIGLALREPGEAVVGGANASHYLADGLYPTDTYVIAHGESIYVLMGAYLSPETDLYRDFQSLLSSFTFIRTADQI